MIFFCLLYHIRFGVRRKEHDGDLCFVKDLLRSLCSVDPRPKIDIHEYQIRTGTRLESGRDSSLAGEDVVYFVADRAQLMLFPYRDQCFIFYEKNPVRFFIHRQTFLIDRSF